MHDLSSSMCIEFCSGEPSQHHPLAKVRMSRLSGCINTQLSAENQSQFDYNMHCMCTDLGTNQQRPNRCHVGSCSCTATTSQQHARTALLFSQVSQVSLDFPCTRLESAHTHTCNRNFLAISFRKYDRRTCTVLGGLYRGCQWNKGLLD